MAEENQTPAPAFYDSWGLSDEDKGFIQNSKYADPSAIIKSLRETKAYVGADKNTLVKVPKPDADGNVDYTEVFKLLGRPETAEEYGLEDTDFAKAIAPKLLELGITKKQAESLAGFLGEYGKTTEEAAASAAAETREKGLANIKKEWGGDFEVRKEVAAKAVRDVAKATGIDEDDLNKLEDTLGVEKALKLFYSIGAKEGGVKSLTGYNAGEETPEIAAFKLKEMLADPVTRAELAKKNPKTHQEILRLTALANKK